MPHPEPLVLMRRAPSGLRRGPLEEFARQLCNRVTGGREFQCLITDDRELRRLNQVFRGKDYPTDVLSFPAECANGSHRRAGAQKAPTILSLLGDIAISADRASEQAREFGHSASEEIRILMLHGVLHLLGMEHARDHGAMARAETAWRKKLGLPAGLIERVRA
jgi:probable rRNA maturation factor